MPFVRQWTDEAILDAIRDWAETYGEPPASSDWNPWHCRNMLHDESRALRYELHPRPLPSFSAPIRRFGSWSRALDAAGFQSRPSGGGGGNETRRRATDRTHCRRGHELTSENTYVVPATGRKQCKTCKEIARQNYRER
jgi:hypothetical protein